FARRNPFLHLYEIGDLDDFFWPHTIWYAFQEEGQVRQLALFYTDMRLPTLLAYPEQPLDSMRELLRALLPLLPRRFYAHLNEQAADVFADAYRLRSHGAHQKMGLTDVSRLGRCDTSGAVALSAADVGEL